MASDRGHRTELPGLLPGVTPDTYHTDQITDQPSLSASIAKLLINQSPAHAYQQHPRLNPNFVRVDDKKFDTGNVAHTIILEGKQPLDVIKVIDGYDDWKKQKAREERDYWRGQGFIPLLDKDLLAVLQMVEAARLQIAEHHADPAVFTDGTPEQTIVWDEGGVTCRSRIDWLRDDFTAIDDLKTTATSALPKAWERSQLFKMGFDIQAAMYVRGITAITGVVPVWRWVVVEVSPPYGLSVITPDETTLEIGNAKFDRALEMWRDCLESGLWPAYGREVHVAAAPAWETRWISDLYEEDAWAQM